MAPESLADKKFSQFNIQLMYSNRLLVYFNKLPMYSNRLLMYSNRPLMYSNGLLMYSNRLLLFSTNNSCSQQIVHVLQQASDVWSYGVTIWEVFSDCKAMPYSGMNYFGLLVQLKKGVRLDRPDSCPT
ncbi:hypothetical protein SARC_13361, partial [Sphaeroforma arctica JP610]